MGKAETYFEQIPVREVKRRVKDIDISLPLNRETDSETRDSSKLILHCNLCRKPVPVETAKTDGYGQAIHEECYLFSVTDKATPSRTRRAQL